MANVPSKGVALGQHQDYVDQYDASLLQSIERAPARAGLPVLAKTGVDLWTSYELSWLNEQGKPCVAIAEFSFTAGSSHIVESKSFKYYLNSFSQTAFSSRALLLEALVRDLTLAAGGEVQVELYGLEEFARKRSASESLGSCLDNLPLTVGHYQPAAHLLQQGSGYCSAVWFSHLLKTNCPVTGQPDWGSVWVGYEGKEILPESLLAYIVSFRQHQDFHEQCVERMFSDLWQFAQPQNLWVYARYTRRGGLDINPFRSSYELPVPQVIAARQ